MKKGNFSDEQILSVLRDAEATTAVPAQERGFSSADTDGSQGDASE